MTRARRSWRQAELVRESVANVFDPRSRHALVVGAAAVLGLAMSFFLVGEWSILQRELDALRADGRNVVTFSSAQSEAPTAISVRSCSGLRELAGVVRAGSVAFGDSATFVQLGPLVPINEVSADLVPALAFRDAVVGSELAAAPGPITLRAPDGSLLEAVIAAPEPSGMAGLTTSLSIPLSGARVSTDTCVAELSRFADVDTAIPVLAAALEVRGGEMIGTAVLRESYDVLSAYRERPQRFLPLAVGMLVGVLGVVLLRTRSSELAAYRLSGTSRADLAALLLWEQLAVSGVLVAFGSVGLLLQGLLGRPVQADDLLWTVAAGLVVLVFSGAFSVLGLRGSPADLARDR